MFHEDHIFPQSEFQVRALKKRGYDEAKIDAYLSRYNTICNLQLLTDSENLSKNATPFDEWLQTRDAAFRKRHLIPDRPDYGFDHFKEFADARTGLIVGTLKALNEGWHPNSETLPDETPGETDDDGSEGKAGGEGGSGKQGGGDSKYEMEIRRLKEEALSKRNPVEVMQVYLKAPPNAQGQTPAQRYEELDRERAALIDGTLKPLVEEYLAGKVPLDEFKSKVEAINKRQNRWGFRGIKGQMFFNIVVNVAPDAAECDQEIKAAVRVPTDEDVARSRIQRFADYVRRIGDAHVKSGGGKQGRPKTGSIPFFLSYFWQVQDWGTWPIYYTNAVETMSKLGIWQPGHDPADNYIAFKHLYEQLAQSFTKASGKSFNLYGVEHVFWLVGEHPFEE